MEVVTTEKLCPRIYVACLASYNAGRLHGAWIEAAQEPWAIWEAVQLMLRQSGIPGAEEFAIHDYEGFGSAYVAEYKDFERINDLAAFSITYGALGSAVLIHFGGHLKDARSA